MKSLIDFNDKDYNLLCKFFKYNITELSVLITELQLLGVRDILIVDDYDTNGIVYDKLMYLKEKVKFPAIVNAIALEVKCLSDNEIKTIVEKMKIVGCDIIVKEAWNCNGHITHLVVLKLISNIYNLELNN